MWGALVLCVEDEADWGKAEKGPCCLDGLVLIAKGVLEVGVCLFGDLRAYCEVRWILSSKIGWTVTNSENKAAYMDRRNKQNEWRSNEI